MLHNKKITVFYILFLAVIFLLPSIGLAQDNLGVNDLGQAGVNLSNADLIDTISSIINIALGFLGILATIIILYGGFIWMTSQGSADKIDRAKRIIVSGIIGLVIILSAYAIARFVINQVENPGGSGSNNWNPDDGYIGDSGLAGGVLESHYPARNATGIARNTNIYLTFAEPMDVSTIVSDPNCNGNSCQAHSNNIQLFKQGDPNPITGADLVISYDVYNQASGEGQRVFQINPYGNTPDYLGDPNGEVEYRMDLGSLLTLNDSEAFPLSGGYSWEFTVSNEVDLTPPTVSQVVPAEGSLNNPRNSSIIINFSEAVNPVYAAGTYPGFTNITVADAGGNINGQYIISNQYRTVEFITDELCGQNSCGGDVYCLPGGQNIIGTITPAIEDMAGNTLDCGANCDAGNYVWSFDTNNDVDLIPPVITEMTSNWNGSSNSMGSPDEPIEITFDKDMLSSSVNYQNIDLDSNPSVNYWFNLQNNRTIVINHDDFEWQSSSSYTATLSSGLKDSLQNCWYPCACDDPGGTCVCDNNNAGTNCPGINCEVQ